MPGSQKPQFKPWGKVGRFLRNRRPPARSEIAPYPGCRPPARSEIAPYPGCRQPARSEIAPYPGCRQPARSEIAPYLGCRQPARSESQGRPAGVWVWGSWERGASAPHPREMTRRRRGGADAPRSQRKPSFRRKPESRNFEERTGSRLAPGRRLPAYTNVPAAIPANTGQYLPIPADTRSGNAL
jgi:hypothetical protein